MIDFDELEDLEIARVEQKAVAEAAAPAAATAERHESTTHASSAVIDFDELDDLETARAEQEAVAEAAGGPVAANAQEEIGEVALDAWQPWRPIPPERWATFPRGGAGDKPTNMSQFKKVVNESVPGEFYGMLFPHSPKQLREMGPAWLTRAFRASGMLADDNEVLSFTGFDVKAENTLATSGDEENANWGGAGCKVLLSVEYKYPVPGLSQDMFIKFPHEFTGKNERYKNSAGSVMDWPEVMFYNTLGGRLPVRTPKGYFSDMSRMTTNFINVTERIPYGDSWEREYKPGEIFPPPGKYRDWTIPCAADLYYAHAKAMARFCGWHYEIRKETDQIEHLFMDDAQRAARNGIFAKFGPLSKEDRDKLFIKCLTDKETAGLIATQGFPPNICQGFLDIARDFVQGATHTFPKEFMSKAYLDRFFNEAREMSYYAAEMQFYTYMMPEYFSLIHPNAQIDNAFYWRNVSGEVECGLVDWGACMHGNMPAALASGWMGAEPGMMDEHEDRLIRTFLDEYEKMTDVKLDFDDFYMHFKLSLASVLFGCCANTRWLRTLITKDQWKSIKSRRDPLIDDSFLVRCYFVQLEMLLGTWKRRSPYRHFQRWMQRTKMPKKHP